MTPERAYGERDDGAVQVVQREQFHEEIELEVGMTMAAQTEQRPLQFSVAAITKESVTVDFNHVMAGKTLRFAVEVVEIRDAAPEELSHGHVHGPGGHHH
jgi:FKBP-type peptidyl-prolyl cis-trans isomerase SlyD